MPASNTSAYIGALLLDLDGTLLDTAKDFITALNKLCLDDRIIPPSNAAIRNTVSDGARALVKLCYGLDEGDVNFEEKRHKLLDYYERELGQSTDFFAGFSDVFVFCKTHHIAWGIITNKPWRFTQPLIKSLSIQASNDVILCPDHVSKSKPDPESMYLAARKLHLTTRQCLYAGDHISDIEAGRNAGMTTIACSYGYIKTTDDIHTWQADHIINQPQDFIALLSQHFSI